MPFSIDTASGSSKMEKKGSIFKTITGYFGSHPGSVVAWLWVSIMPALGSLVLALNYQILESFHLETLQSIFLYLFLSASLMGLALLPTTLTALASGFFFGWIALPLLVVSYSGATAIGYFLGKRSNSGLLDSLFSKNPNLREELERRKSKESNLVFFVRISPIIPFAVSNFLFASMNVSLLKVLIFGALGMLPRTFIVFAAGLVAQNFLGAQESINTPLHWAGVLVFLLIGAWGIYSYLKKTPPSA